MDVLTLAKAKKYAQALIDTLSGEIEGDLEEITQDIKDLGQDASIIDMDGDTASVLILNALRQLKWQIDEEEGPICEEGSVTLTNSLKFPFNDSESTVALVNTQPNTKYAVIADITSANGNAGEVVVSGKQTNGFKLAYTGSASTAVVHYIVIGGIIE